MDNEFWRVKSMEDFTQDEWDSICLKCGKCCAVKASDTRCVHFYNRVCDGLDMNTGLCKRYENRLCEDCLKVDFRLLCKQPYQLPEECAYRMLKEKGYLPEYHPLITGDSESVRKAGQTVLDWEDIHSIADIREATNAVLKKANEEEWSMEQFEDAVSKAIKNFTLHIVKTYKM